MYMITGRLRRRRRACKERRRFCRHERAKAVLSTAGGGLGGEFGLQGGGISGFRSVGLGVGFPQALSPSRSQTKPHASTTPPVPLQAPAALAKSFFCSVFGGSSGRLSRLLRLAPTKIGEGAGLGVAGSTNSGIQGLCLRVSGVGLGLVDPEPLFPPCPHARDSGI